MFALGRTERVLLAALALASLAGAFATTPIVARSAAALQVPAAMPSAAVLAADDPLVTPHRDPFAGGIALTSPAPSPAAVSAAPPALPAIPAIPGFVRALPPNAGADGAPRPFAAPRLTAVVAGRHPFALIDDGGTSRLLTVGDAFGASTIVAIRDDGIALADGSRFGLDPAPTLHGEP
ncbi:hypothetical protein WPS_16610 [Vulcanimicrobium alpinum]|uniref:Type II secretion system protein GspC N-terminal domain-containing protein n=1 Tax=Vulcanimicrobium alpinum TaxID=3016050 RepID=A0AAN1XWQ9_UNVUL|nr:hypothetical protein [Vulcanimicrobium alpinum]BDE06385.1 hypothetical protein WPS_16610 [Vulcanimicrobium alpinum]